MIYTVISSIYSYSVDEFLSENHYNIKKSDCRILRQPLKPLPTEISEYSSVNDPLTMHEKKFAYTTLLSFLNLFFNICPKIERTSSGKPYFSDSKLKFNISHSYGVIAITISDESEVGVDIQGSVNEEKADRLEKRFLSEVEAKYSDTGAVYYFCEITHTEAIFTQILPEKSAENNEKNKLNYSFSDRIMLDFIDRWTYFESILKLHGEGFGASSRILELSEKANSETINFIFNDKIFSLSTSIHK